MRPLLLALGVALLPAVSGAQRDTTAAARNRLPPEVAREVVALFNATTTLRVTDALEIPAGKEVPGDVAVLNGPVTIAGHVAGRVLAINADVLLRKGARIDGDLLVVGGEVEGSEGTTIGGELRVYHPPLHYTQEGDRLVVLPEDAGAEGGNEWWRRFEWNRRSNSNRLEVANAGVYNRVEGLPIRVGPVLYRDQGWGHLQLDAQAILRTGSSFSSSTADVGHLVRGEMRTGAEYGATIGAQLFDMVDGVESWQLSNAEVGLASFLFRRDYRDYYRRHGGRLFATLRATESADLTLTYGDERWLSRETRNPPALFSEDRGWRPNPAMDAGRFHLADATLRVDTRNDELNPWAGWYLLADLEYGAGTIDELAPTSAGVRDLTTAGVVTRYQRGFLDVRRYNRLAPTAALNLRLVLGGWIGGDALPLERRLSIDGPGTVPGFDFRSAASPDVGTCTSGAAPLGHPAECDRIALAQLEYRSDLHISIPDWREDAEGHRNRFRVDAAWIFFADAGRGWLVNSPGDPLNLGRRDFPALSSYRTDIGLGLDFDLLGVYVAKALSVPQEPANVFVRLRRRF
ncbi:MAG TPA: hypothetical protein VGG78_10360 [Gemmatimonadaceae bacterium]